MDDIIRFRRVGILCCHFIRNYAYYKSGWHNGIIKNNSQFWITLNGNFLDICVLEWLKLFGNHNNKHHWKKIVSNKVSFRNDMFRELSIDQAEFDKIHQEIKCYRDRFVAHLDSDPIMNIPDLSMAMKMVIFYYNQVKIQCGEPLDWHDDLEVYYDNCFKDGLTNYSKKHITK